MQRSEVSSMGRGGIDIVAGNWRELDPGFTIIENCRISDLSRIDHTYTPAIVVEGMGPVIRHNSFVNIPSSAIRLATLDALVELNYFHNCVYESGDQGAIDVFGNPLYRGKVDDGISFANIDGNENFHGTSPESIKPFVLPWHPIPVDHIGPYDSNRGNK